jgi:FkbM family methyltransferase
MTGTTRSPQLAAGRNPKLATTRTTTVIDALSSTELGMSVLLVKVDVEGAEIHVLQALQPMLSSIENLVVETSPGWWTEGTT